MGPGEYLAAGTSCRLRRLVKDLLIACLMLQISVALGQSSLIFQFDGNGSLSSISRDRGVTLEVRNDTSAYIVEIQKDDMNSSGNFQFNGLWNPPLRVDGRHMSGAWQYRNPIKLIRQSAMQSFSTMFDVQLQLDERIADFQLQTTIFGFEITRGNDQLVYVGIEVLQAQDGLYLADLRIDRTGYSQGGPAYGRISWLGDLISQGAGTLQNIRIAMWIEYNDNNKFPGEVIAGASGVLTVYVSGTGGQLQACSTNGTDSPLLCKPPTALQSLVGLNFTEAVSQNGDMIVGFSAGNVTGYCSINGWTFNSDGPSPDFPRDFNGVVLFPKGDEADEGKSRRSMIRILEFTIPAVLVVFLLLIIICTLYRRNARLTALAKKFDIDTGLLEKGPRNFKYRELSTATKDFSLNEMIGKGGFGPVYRGSLVLKGDLKPTKVAVKRISASSRQGAQEFLAEVRIIGRAQHRNLVRLLGWCNQRGELLLVYEYMPNGSLDQLLYKEKNHAQGFEPELLTWTRRLNIVSGIATALAFLHEEWEHRVIHRDVKSSNVMLDSEFNARLGDFGLARMYEHDQVAPSTAILAGTFGYMAPELFHSLKLTEKTDVYSFGVLALEVATGRRPLVNSSGTDKSFVLVDWVRALYRDDKLLNAADCRLQNAYDAGEMLTFLKLGLLCTHPDPNERPTMRDVINIWKGSSSFPQMPPSRLFSVPVVIPLTESEIEADTDVVTSTSGSKQSDVSTLDSHAHTAIDIASRHEGNSLQQRKLLRQKSGPLIPGLPAYKPPCSTTSVPF